MVQRSFLLFLVPLLGLAAACGPDPVPPQFTSTPVAQAVTGEAYAYAVEVTGEPAPTVFASGLPSWLTLEGSVLGGTPSESDVGDHTITLTANNGTEPDAVQTFTLTVVLAQSAPTFTSTAVTSATEGELYRYTPSVVGHPAVQITATTLPGWLQFENGALVGTPGYEHAGDHPVVLTASNGLAPDAIQTFTVTVTAVSEAPVFTSAPVTAATEGQAYRYTVGLTGHPAPTLAATALPAWLSFDAATGVLSGTPDYMDGGLHTVVLTAHNGISPDATQSFSISVTTVSTAPGFTANAPTTATEGQPYSFTVTTSGTPAPTVTANTLPAWLSFDAASGLLSGTPAYADGGIHGVMLTAHNGISPDATLAFTISVTTVSTPPLFTASAPTTATEGQPYSFTVTTTGTPAPTVTATTLPSWLSFDAASGVLSGTPAYADGGVHTVLLSAHNGISPDATLGFTVSVTTVSVPPAITSTPLATAIEGTAFSYTVVTTGTPAPVVTAQGGSGAPLPGWLSFDAASSVLSGTAGPADVGTHDVVITASNGIGQDATQTFTITVESADMPPLFTSTPVTSALPGQLFSYTAAASGRPAPTFTAAVAGGGALPAWLSIDSATGVLSGTPGASDVGPLQVEVTADNGVPPAATQAFTLNVASAEVTVTSTAPAGRVGALYSYTVTTSGFPAPTVSFSGLPAWLTFDGTATISGTPTTAGTTATITVTASNGVSANGTQTFTIEVAPLPPIAVAGGTFLETFGPAAPLGWSVQGGVWAFGIPTVGADSVGPPALLDGEVAATNLTAAYPSSMNARLQSPTFDLTGVTHPVLKFSHWYNFERSTTASIYDGGNLKLSTDGGATWSAVAPGTIFPAYAGPVTASGNALNTQPVFTGILSGWETVAVDLSANLDGLPVDQVAIRFDAGSDGSVNRPGWYVDNFQVGAAADLGAPAVIVSAPVTSTLFAGVPFTYTVTATGVPAPTLTAAGAAGAPLPAWLSFDAATGVLSGTPAATGSHTVVLSADNGATSPSVQTLTLNVIATDLLTHFIFDGSVATPEHQLAGTTTSGVTTGSGTPTFPGGNPGEAISANGFHDAQNPNYFQFTVSPDPTYHFTPVALSFDHYRSNTGPAEYEVSVVVGGVETMLAGGAGTTGAGTTWHTANVILTPAERGPYNQPVTFRIYGRGASGGGGTWRLDNVELLGLVAVEPLPAAITSTPPTTAVVDTLYTYTVTATGYPVPTVTTSGRPSWLSYDAATGTLSGTPTIFNVGTTGTITVTATNPSGPAATQTFTITVQAPAAVPVADGAPFVEGFGTGTPAGWAFTGQWEFGLPATGGSTVGPPSVWNGEVAATRLSGNYANNAHWLLQTPIMDLTGVTTAGLTFMHWHNFEGTAANRYDGGNVQVSTDGGATFQEFAPTTVAPAYTGAAASTNALGGQQIWSGTLTGWTPVTIDLEAHLAGRPRNQVVIRFAFGSDGSTGRPGWYLDDVKIGAVADL